MLTEIPAEQFTGALDTCVREVLAEGEWIAPPVDAILLARRLEMQVAYDTAMDVRARFVRLGGVGGLGPGTILLADDPRPERRQWAVAHEIGEYAAHRVFAHLGVHLHDIPPAARERVANQLATCLLLPSDWFSAEGPAVDWDLFSLKQIYRTASHELIARRMLQMSPPVIITLFDQGKLKWRRSNVLKRPPPLIAAELKTWKETYTEAEPTSAHGDRFPDGIECVHCWPVHEPGWRREIMRTGLEIW